MLKPYVSNVNSVERARSFHKMCPNFMFKQVNPGKYMDVTLQRLKVVNFKSVCIFERKLNVTSTSVVEALKSIFCDIGAPDKLISDNMRYFVSDEYENFTAKWNIVHVTLSSRYPQGNSHIEKAIQSVKAIHEKCHNVKMGLLMLKTTLVVSGHDHKAPAETFFKHQLKANVPIFGSTQQASDHNRDEQPMMTSKFRNHDAIWCKVNPNIKWRPGHIIDVLPNQSYLIELEDGRQFRKNEHHITGHHLHPRNGAKPPDDIKMSPEQSYNSYNLRPRVKQSVK